MSNCLSLHLHLVHAMNYQSYLGKMSKIVAKQQKVPVCNNTIIVGKNRF